MKTVKKICREIDTNLDLLIKEVELGHLHHIKIIGKRPFITDAPLKEVEEMKWERESVDLYKSLWNLGYFVWETTWFAKSADILKKHLIVYK